jgi:hypothetical protein
LRRHHHSGPAGPTRGSRFDNLGNQHPRTHAARYRVVREAWRRKVENGELVCEQLAGSQGDRMVRITAYYTDLEGTQIVKPVICDSEDTEILVVRELTERIRTRATSRNARTIAHWQF